MVRVEFGAFNDEVIKLSMLTTSFGIDSKEAPPPPPGEELLDELRKRLGEAEKTIGKLRDEATSIKQDKDIVEEELQKCRAENLELRSQLASVKTSGRDVVRFGFELEEQERLADHVAELEQERIVLAGMYRSASRRCAILEQRLAARAQAALNLAMEAGRTQATQIVVAGDHSVHPEEGVEVLNEREALDGHEGLWDAPDNEDDDRWCRGDWENVVGLPEGLTFKDLPLEQCRQILTVSESRLRVEDWVARHACRCKSEPNLEGGSDSVSLCFSSTSQEELLSMSSSAGDLAFEARAADPARLSRAYWQGADAPEKESRVDNGDECHAHGRKHRFIRLREEVFTRARNPMTSGVTRAAWKTGSFAVTGQCLKPERGLFTSLLSSGSTPDKSKSFRQDPSVVSFAT